MNNLKEQGLECILLEDGALSHKSRIATDYLRAENITKIAWAGHSPDLNASEHAWPRIRRDVTKNFTPSKTEEECEQQWIQAWEELPISIINRWVDMVPEVVRRIIRSHGKNNFHG